MRLRILFAALTLAACSPEAGQADAETRSASSPEASPSPAARAPADVSAHADFQRFFADFRQAVIDNDREAVAAMTALPFVDYRAGYYCEPGQEDCTVPPEALTSADKAAFLANYDRIFTPEVVAAIRHRKVVEGVAADENVSPAVLDGEYVVDLENTDLQRVFARQNGVYKLSRVPFYA